MKPPIYPNNVLTVIIRDDAPMIHCGDSPTYRSVSIQLTNEQIAMIALRNTHHCNGKDHFEEISKCFIEPYISLR